MGPDALQAPPVESETVELISIDVRGQAFAIDIMAVREIRGWTQATPVPHAPHDMRGVINLRGTVLPILDLGARLGLGDTDPTSRHAIVVASVRSSSIGLLVDGVAEILSVPTAEIQSPPDLCRGGPRSVVRGMLPNDGRLIKVLSLDDLLPASLDLAA